jgi:hypothetical protein
MKIGYECYTNVLSDSNAHCLALYIDFWVEDGVHSAVRMPACRSNSPPLLSILQSCLGKLYVLQAPSHLQHHDGNMRSLPAGPGNPDEGRNSIERRHGHESIKHRMLTSFFISSISCLASSHCSSTPYPSFSVFCGTISCNILCSPPTRHSTAAQHHLKPLW